MTQHSTVAPRAVPAQLTAAAALGLFSLMVPITARDEVTFPPGTDVRVDYVDYVSFADDNTIFLIGFDIAVMVALLLSTVARGSRAPRWLVWVFVVMTALHAFLAVVHGSLAATDASIHFTIGTWVLLVEAAVRIVAGVRLVRPRAATPSPVRAAPGAG
ncbi:hypothetical protein Daura_24345 [Dactylosporangium aurantiacum]|uniref:Uncharacterized protein n=1 Tax=Dactylosporangium aurantiacum TaxID=35754 RepID=A0A9Q9IT70_9ACTN|nr:hypothetical protein [Dactylosporangium aurantiacum]MDG6103775.1 hypothetical protein [Dactylosporangium aurantiacum]UWZ59014.1 hypothetical protein Daura_24345 [Dactylosporangium aurantiacum]